MFMVVLATLEFEEDKWDLEMYKDDYDTLVSHFASKGQLRKEICYPITITDTSNKTFTFDLMDLKRMCFNNTTTEPTILPHSLKYAMIMEDFL